jgi:hypothetical protein
MLWLIIALILDISSYAGSAYSNKQRITAN